MKKIMLVFGTRPEGIKMCPLVNELKRRPQVQTVVCVTGQHKQMLQQVLDAFSVVPDYDLAIMQPNQTLFDVTTAVLTRIQAVLNQEKPDLTLVHGDTSTAFVTALACFYLHIPVGHVEAGLRTYNLESPFPEEFNRQAVSLICRYHFAPTEKAKQNLLREGKDESSIFVTGNTSIDALKTTVRADYTHPELTWAKGSRLILITAHRRENLGEAMHHMFRAIRRVLTEHPDVKALYPIHLNPVVRQEAAEELSGLERLHIIEPLDVLDFHNIMAHSTLILTDSGGFQVFSLAGLRKIKEEGVTFHSHVDGRLIFMGPEESMQIQSNLASTIAMAFDECAPAKADRSYIQPSVDRTTRWLERCKREMHRLNSLEDTINKQQMLFGINQGGVIDDIRIEHAKRIADMDLDGYAIGGLAVGETHAEMYRIIESVIPYLPENKPTYLMGVGTPANILEAVERGVDFFDCVYPSRNGRHGHVYTNHGKLNLFNAKYELDERPIEEGCGCPACRKYSRAYIRHLLKAKEMLGMRFCVLHNLYFYNNMMSEIREAIEEHRYSEYKRQKLEGFQNQE